MTFNWDQVNLTKKGKFFKSMLLEQLDSYLYEGNVNLNPYLPS